MARAGSGKVVTGFPSQSSFADCVNLSAIPLYTFEIDHVHQLELVQLKLIVI
jgi:hypothetical protein